MRPQFIIAFKTCPADDILKWLVDNCGLDQWCGKTGYIGNMTTGIHAELHMDDDWAVMFKLMFPESKSVNEMGEYHLKPIHFIDNKIRRMPSCIDFWPMPSQL